MDGASKGPDETWVVLMRVSPPNLLMGPFPGVLDAMAGVPEEGWEAMTFCDSLEEAVAERNKELVFTMEREAKGDESDWATDDELAAIFKD